MCALFPMDHTGLWLASGVLPTGKMGASGSPWSNPQGFFATRRPADGGPPKMMAAVEGSVMARALYDGGQLTPSADDPSKYYTDCKGADSGTQHCIDSSTAVSDKTGVNLAQYSVWMQDRRWDVPQYV